MADKPPDNAPTEPPTDVEAPTDAEAPADAEAPTDAPTDGLTEADVEAETEPKIENEEETELTDYTPLSANEDPEKLRDYKEYKRLERDIKYQNEMLENLKTQIHEFSLKKCLTKEEIKELKILNETWELELTKLRDLISKAIHLQNFGSKRNYREFPLITTFDEDNLNITNRTCNTMRQQCRLVHSKTSKFRSSGGESSDFGKPCSCNGSQMSVTDEKELMKEIFAALNELNSINNCKQKSKPPASSCKESDSLENLKKNICYMQEAISKLHADLKKREYRRSCPDINQNRKIDACKPAAPIEPLILCPPAKTCKAEQLQQLKENYIHLLSDFSKKDEQLKQLTKKLKDSCAKCNTNCASPKQEDANDAELMLLRNRVEEMKEEQVEFKCLMREQSQQLEEYRNKYLTAQQKVEEQVAILDKLQCNNKRIEKQINMEVKEIRAKFQEKLNELLHYPKLLENEQLKLAKVCKVKDDLENKLLIVCKELKNLKTKAQSNNEEDCKPQLQRCQQELCHAKKNLEEITRQRDMFCEQLRATKDDLDTLRSESAKIIARTKERAECLKLQQSRQIDRLEKQLAQCRATACLSVNDREAVIKEMQGQLNTLSYSFDSAQKQIKTLRNHIAYMSNENSFPTKC